MIEKITMLDFRILDFIQAHLTSPILDKIMIFLTYLGNDGFIWICICAILIISPKTRYIGLVGLISLLFSLILGNEILKNLIQRDRPFLSEHFKAMNYKLLIKAPSSYSFPSGHTSSSFAAAFVFGHYFKKPYYIYTYILAALIAFSRLYLYVHFPSDVFAGIILGYICSLLAILIAGGYKKQQERRLLNG